MFAIPGMGSCIPSKQELSSSMRKKATVANGLCLVPGHFRRGKFMHCFSLLLTGLLALSLLGGPIWADNVDTFYDPPVREEFSVPAKTEATSLPLSQA
jgi:hypothetical protein